MRASPSSSCGGTDRAESGIGIHRRAEAAILERCDGTVRTVRTGGHADEAHATLDLFAWPTVRGDDERARVQVGRCIGGVDYVTPGELIELGSVRAAGAELVRPHS